MTLNGWQRVGIVVSVIWLVSVLSFAAIELITSDKYRFLNEGQTHSFVYWSSPLIIDPFELRIGENINLFSEREQLEILRKRKHISEGLRQKVFYGRLFGWLFLPIIAGWTFSYVYMFVIKWVRAGFSPNNKRT